MKINGKLVFDASSASEIQNLRVEKVTINPAPSAADVGRVIYNTGDKTLYVGREVSAGAYAWVALATGGDAASLQTEVDAIETSLGAIVNGSGVFVAGQVTGPAISAYTTGSGPGGAPGTVTELFQALSNYANANNTLAELDDVSFGTLDAGDFLRYNGTVWVDSTIDLATDLGITASAAELNVLDGITASTTELNILDGVTATAAELNILDGATLTTTELNFVDGVTSSIQNQLDNKQPLDATLTSLAALSGTGILVESGVDTFTHRTLVAPAAGITITNANGALGDPTFALANDLAALEGLTTTGYVVRTGDGTATTRSMSVVSGDLVITGAADGVSTDTTFGLANVTQADSGTFLKVTLDGKGRVTGNTAVTTADITALVDATYVNIGGDTMTGNLNMGSTNKVTGLAAPTADTDAATKAYVDATAAGLSWKQAVRAATTANVDLATDLEAGDILDGVTLVAGDRVLVKNQTAAADNGIYIVQATGAAVRSADLNTAAEFSGATVFVTEGSANADSGWTQTAEVVTVGTTAVSFAQFSGSSTYTWGTGLAASGNTVYINLGAGIAELPSDEVGLDIVSGKAVQLTTTDTGGKLTFVLDTGSGLEQSASGLKISAAGVTNAMLAHSQFTINGDTGNDSLVLGDVLQVKGTSTQGISTVVTESPAGTSTFTITAADATDSQKGVAKFNTADFAVNAGDVTIKAGGVDNAQLANSTITVAGSDASSDAVALGETLTFSSAVSGLVSSTVAANGVALDVRLASTTETGVASFNSAHFSVASGAVSLAASLDDLDNVSSADTAATGDLLTKTASDWQPVSRVDLAGSIKLGDLQDVGTAAATTAGTALIADGSAWQAKKVYHLYTSGAAGTSHSVAHNIGQMFCNVTVVDSTNNVVIPESIVFNDANNLTVTFNTAIDCKIVVMGIA